MYHIEGRNLIPSPSAGAALGGPRRSAKPARPIHRSLSPRRAASIVYGSRGPTPARSCSAASRLARAAGARLRFGFGRVRIASTEVVKPLLFPERT